MKKRNNTLILMILCIISITVSAQVQIPQNGLVGWWPFTGNANDGSGNGNNGSTNLLGQGPQLTTDRFGNANSAYLFGGFYNPCGIVVPNSASLTLDTQATVSFWFQQCRLDGMDNNGNYNSTTGARFAIFCKTGSGSSSPHGICFSTLTNPQQNQIGIYCQNANTTNGNNVVHFSHTAQYKCFDTCEWIHYACVINGRSAKYYLNGRLALDTVIANINLTSANGDSLFFGIQPSTGPNHRFPFYGKIDDIALYNRALSAAEIIQLNGNYSDPLAANNTIRIWQIIMNTACNGNNGYITITPDISNGPFQYAIDNPANMQSSNTFRNISDTTHRIFVKNSCTLWDTVIDFACNRIYRTVCHGDTIVLPAGNWYYDSLHSRPVNGNVVRPDTNTTYYRSNNMATPGSGVDFAYTGYVQTYTVPAGVDSLTLQVWGAQGGQGGPSNLGGKGGFAEGRLHVTPGQTLYIYVGGQGQGSTTAQQLTGLCAGGWNGGGTGNNYMTNSGSSNGVRGGGGGATDISLQGTAGSTTWNTNNHLYSRVIVAGGGGGNLYFSTLSNIYPAGCGGGTTGDNGYTNANAVAGYGGTQTAGGANSSTYANYTNASFGAGASGSTGQYTLSGGGGGWYGGGAGNAAGGGSGYVYTASTAANYPAGCLLNSSHYLANAYTSNCTSTFPAPNGGTEQGHSGNGFARIITGDTITHPPLVVTVLPTYRDTVSDTICKGATYQYHDSIYTAQGIYTHTLSSINGCDSIVVLNLTVLDTFRTSRFDTICNGQRFTYGTSSYTTQGIYPQLHPAANGCDSTVILNLTVNDTFHLHIYDTVCAGYTYIYNNQPYTIAGTYLQTLSTTRGCDSVLHIHLYVNDTLRQHIYDTICHRQHIIFNDSILGRTGLYRHMTRTPQSCDSITYLHLWVNDTSVTHIYDTLFNNFYTYHDSTYYTSGTYRYLLHKTLTGCDSTVILHIKLCDSIITTINDTACNDSTYYFGGRLICSSGRYTNRLISVTGCDSIVVLKLILIDRPTLRLHTSPYCENREAEIFAITNGNSITWSASPTDTSLIGQEHNDTIYVTPQRRTQYTASADIVPSPRSCPSSATIALPKPSRVVARIAASPDDISVNQLQTKFSDVSLGEIASRKWLMHEINTSAPDRTQNDSVVYYSPSVNCDTLEVTLSVINNVGCKDTIRRLFPILKGDVWPPNAFTPDGTNNYLFKVGTNNIAEYHIYIYSRNGLLVFQSDDPEISWDGKYKGKPCTAGSYTYVIRYATSAHKKQPLQKVGTVLLVR